jgi:hypothetical protein
MAVYDTMAPQVVETVDQFGQVGFVETMGAPVYETIGAPVSAPIIAGQAKVIGGGIQGLPMVEAVGAPGVVETVDQFGNVGFVETMGAPQVAYASAPLAYGAAPVSYGAAPMSYGAAPVSYAAAPMAFGTTSYGTRMAGAQQSFACGNYAGAQVSYGTTYAGGYAQAPVSYGTTYAGGYAQPYTGGSVFGSQPFSFSAANAATVTAAVPKVVTTQKAKRGCC